MPARAADDVVIMNIIKTQNFAVRFAHHYFLLMFCLTKEKLLPPALLYIILLVNNFRVKNFRHFAQNENFLTTKNSQITVLALVVYNH